MLPVNFALEKGWAYDKDGKHVTTAKTVRQQIEGISVGYKVTTPTTDVIGQSANLKFYHFGPTCCSGYTITTGHGSPQASVGLNFTSKIIIPFVSN